MRVPAGVVCELDVTACLADFDETRGFQFPSDFAERKGFMRGFDVNFDIVHVEALPKK